MATWGEFAAARADLAEAGRALLYQHGVGLGYLATTRADGGPRVHPICPILARGGVFAFIVPSPKQQDLRRDGRYAIHSFPCPDNEDAFYFSGTAHLVEDGALRAALAEQFVEERSQFAVPPPAEADEPFEFSVDACLLTRTTGHGDARPVHTVWGAEGR
jgi:hypothetical protein